MNKNPGVYFNRNPEYKMAQHANQILNDYKVLLTYKNAGGVEFTVRTPAELTAFLQNVRNNQQLRSIHLLKNPTKNALNWNNESTLHFSLQMTKPEKNYYCDKDDYSFEYEGGVADGQEGCLSPHPQRGADMVRMMCKFAGFPLPAGMPAAGGARKSRKASRKNRKASRKSRKASRKNRKASRKNRKASRKNRKASRKNRKASRKNRKASRKNRKASRKNRKASRKNRKASRKNRK